MPYILRFGWAVRRHRALLCRTIGRADWVMIHGETHLLAARLLCRSLDARLLYALRSNTVAVSDVYLNLGEGGPLMRMATRASRRKYMLYEQLSSRWAAVVALQSEFDRRSYLSRVPRAEDRTVVIGGNIGPPRFRDQDRDINRSTRLRELVYVGGLGKRKGTWPLVTAVAMLRELGVKVRLTIVGSGGMLETIADFAAERGLTDAFRLVGRQSNPFQFIGEADLMIVPSLFDSYPDTVLEALHAGTPVIGSRTGGIPDMLQHKELLFQPGSAQVIRDRVKNLYDRPDLYRRAKELCRERRDHFLFDWVGEFERVMTRGITDGARE
jgi:glycosyltransferase involved in cell wall biosynthesis